MTTKSNDALQNQIERLVRAHLAAQRDAATRAIERAFASVAVTTTPAPAKVRRARRQQGRRRPPDEVGDLAQRLFDAVRAAPGETMTVFAAQLGQTPRALNRPMSNLKRAGRIRSAGQRNYTRYFPMTSSK